MKTKSRKGKKTEKVPPREPSPPSEEILLESPYAIIDAAVSDAARTIARAAQGEDISREQLASAQDILNRKGITSAGNKANVIPEAFAREAFSTVFRLLGFPPIKWPRLTPEPAVEKDEASVDEFNTALQET